MTSNVHDVVPKVSYACAESPEKFIFCGQKLLHMAQNINSYIIEGLLH